MKLFSNLFYIKLASIICVMTSCNKLIEIPPNPPNQIPASVLFADSSGIMSAWASIYNSMGPSIINSYSGAITITTGLAGDEIVTFTGGSASDVAMQNNNITSSEGKAYGCWRDGYVNLFRINSCLENIADTKAISEQLKNQLIGEARFVRAYTYFYLVNLFGPVPLITSTDYVINKRLSRTSVDSVYAQIINDLTEAEVLLMDNYPSAGRARPNKQVANALLARVYLYRGQWEHAEVAANKVITSGKYSLVDLPSVFLKGNNEAIWQLPSNGTNAQTAEGFTLIPTANNRIPTYFLTESMLNSFEPVDLRKTQWIGVNTVATVAYTYPAKYKNRTVAATPAEDYVLMRLSEMYLIRAEARAHQENTSDAIDDLDMIRNPTRVGLPVYNGATTPSAILDAIMKERRIEFYCEGGHRWYDLKRTGTIDQVLGGKPGWQSTDALLPIPNSERLLNPFLSQNLGYD